MSFNPIKCVVLRISTKKKKVLPTQYELHGHTLEVVDSSKYFGVTIKDDLSWGTHIQNTVSKANRTLGFLRRNMKDCTKPVKDLTYKAMIRPTMEYSSTVWDPALQTHIATLEQVQRRAARYVCNDYHSRTPGCVTKMIDDLNWEPLEVRRRHESTEFSTTSLTYPLTGTYKSVIAVPEDQPNSFKGGFQMLHIPTPSFQEQCGIGTSFQWR